MRGVGGRAERGVGGRAGGVSGAPVPALEMTPVGEVVAAAKRVGEAGDYHEEDAGAWGGVVVVATPVVQL